MLLMHILISGSDQMHAKQIECKAACPPCTLRLMQYSIRTFCIVKETKWVCNRQDNKDAGAYSTYMSCHLKCFFFDSTETNEPKTYPLLMLYKQPHGHFCWKIKSTECKRCTRSLLFHRPSTVTFQACSQDNERRINTVEHKQTSCVCCHLIHIRQKCVYGSVRAVRVWTLWRGWEPCHRRSVLASSPSPNFVLS